ncbi:toxin [Aureimonas endophytica]|uniref:Toxin n=1 Tax=Aureimonas endophytica TaxID=2027858 RepID=A0A916ZFC4_9HYPH|nr:BrnT family toxin [Aureimonas endophytica]GGD93031.1 toxin [Aureimonas endophytica]
MRFEYDPEKSASNLIKHGIDFDEAQRLWTDDRLAIAEARSDDEPRFLAIGRIGDRHWSAIYTLRSERLRLILVRRARAEEIMRYEGR